MVKTKFKKIIRNIAPYFLVLLMMFSFLSFASIVAPHEVYANDPSFTKDTKFGNSTGAVTDITNVLKEWILVLRIIGAVVAVFGIVLGAIVFSISMGNAQKRAMGTGAIISAIVGIIIIAKAPTIADYFISKASTT